MNALGVVYVNHHLQSLTAGTDRRTPRRSTTSLRQRLTGIAGTFRAAVKQPTGTDGSVAPSVR